MAEDDKEICHVGGQRGYFLPRGGDAEAQWPDALKVILYLLGLMWCFMGVAIIADVFMGAIERVTSKKKRVVAKNGKHRTVKVWNDTVANLTLMALGSSAPEILLSCIEIIGEDFQVGPLGPSTIVGSAAFNLLIITAVCIGCIPEKEVRYIKDTSVFAVTASFSIFAYLWLLFILEINSKDIVELWEALVTFAFFPIFVTLAYLADIGVLGCGLSKRADDIAWSEASMEEFAQLERRIRAEHGEHLSEVEVGALMQYQFPAPKNKATYRRRTAREIFKGKKVDTSNQEKGKELTVQLATNRASGETKTQASVATLNFVTSTYHVLENCGTTKLTVKRDGDLSAYHMVAYQTRDGTAEKSKDYEEQAGYLEFQPGEKEKAFEIRIIDDSAFEEVEEFYVELKDPELIRGDTEVMLGDSACATIKIIDDDLPGKLAFEAEEATIEDGTMRKCLTVTVKRSMGATGTIGCAYYTENASAIAGRDYVHKEGVVTLESGQTSATFDVEILPGGRYEGREIFRIYLKDPTGGATFDKTTDGGEDSCVQTVIIEASQDAKDRVSRVMQVMNSDQMQEGHAEWRDQFVAAVYCNGSKEKQADAGMPDWIMHIVSLPWKLIFALVPPVEYADGWVCFGICLVMIGLVTMLISDLANLLGCALTIKPAITAVTLVALGTSLPDTFASKTAAVQERHADASIGNITGSNSVNVFLGIGLPWSIAAIKWNISGPTSAWSALYEGFRTSEKCSDVCFVVPAGGLSFSVAVFSSCAFVCIGVLGLRRIFVGGELGGPKMVAYGTSAFLTALWVLFIALYIWYEG
mmetsp:Transcript_92983/g.240233  ORF Transcript_92983/g.240233 Transcript_92983/m.240233 type:complete len:811 (+) Transcript_92983:88-2520(+)